MGRDLGRDHGQLELLAEQHAGAVVQGQETIDLGAAGLEEDAGDREARGQRQQRMADPFAAGPRRGLQCARSRRGLSVRRVEAVRSVMAMLLSGVGCRRCGPGAKSAGLQQGSDEAARSMSGSASSAACAASASGRPAAQASRKAQPGATERDPVHGIARPGEQRPRRPSPFSGRLVAIAVARQMRKDRLGRRTSASARPGEVAAPRRPSRSGGRPARSAGRAAAASAANGPRSRSGRAAPRRPGRRSSAAGSKLRQEVGEAGAVVQQPRIARRLGARHGRRRRRGTTPRRPAGRTAG